VFKFSYISRLSRFSIVACFIVLSVFIGNQFFTEGVSGITHQDTGKLTYFCLFSLIIPLVVLLAENIKTKNQINEIHNYTRRLTSILVEQTDNESFYNGDLEKTSTVLTKKVATALEVERCSIWLYTEKRKSISCEKLYIRSDNSWQSGAVLQYRHFPEYFKYLEKDHTVIAHDAETHTATKCFLEDYLKPFNIKSMLDVPIYYREQVIGVICIESTSRRFWKDEEINFVQILSSLYSFSYSMRETNQLLIKNQEIQSFINRSSLISITDARGRIIYVNDKFVQVSGYEREELLGKDHCIVNSGKQPQSYWKNMYKTVAGGEIWNDIVANKTKGGVIYYVDTYIRANFNQQGKITGYMSIRQDVTEIVKANNEISKKNTYLEHAAKILRHDMNSGINIYIPRGIDSLQRRLAPEIIKNYKLDTPMKMLREGLVHTQKVYRGVYEFTNLVKYGSKLTKQGQDLKKILVNYLDTTSYKSQVVIEDLCIQEVNESLFCTAIDNLIRNGLKYNDSSTKWVKIYMKDGCLIVEDNGRGLSQDEFNKLSVPYIRKKDQKESGTGLGLSICVAILSEHGFSVSCEKIKTGTVLKIKFC
jgi:PAS domain S-box-containing protein